MSQNDIRLQVLKEARRLLTQKGWTKRTYARDILGESCSEFGPEASCFCLLGALNRASFFAKVPFEVIKSFVSLAYNEIHDITLSLHAFNDLPGTTLTDVLDILDAAILREENRNDQTAD